LSFACEAGKGWSLRLRLLAAGRNALPRNPVSQRDTLLRGPASQSCRDALQRDLGLHVQ
jgi:hypothetical protein